MEYERRLFWELKVHTSTVVWYSLTWPLANWGLCGLWLVAACSLLAKRRVGHAPQRRDPHLLLTDVAHVGAIPINGLGVYKTCLSRFL